MAKPISQTKLQRFIEQSAAMKDDPDYPIFEAGLREGEIRGKNRALTFLELKYTGPDAPVRGSYEGQAILTLAKELSEYMKNG